MSENNSDDLQSPQRKNHEGPPKRRQLDTLNSLTPNSSDNDPVLISKWQKIGLTRELRVVVTELSEIEATVSKLRGMRREMNKIFDEEEQILEVQAKLKRETMEHLELDLEKSYAQEGLDRPATVEVEMAMNRRISGKIKTIMSNNSRRVNLANTEQAATTSKFKESGAEPQMQLEKKIKIELEIQELDSQDSDLEEANFHRIPRKKKKTPANGLEEQLQSAKNAISTTREGLKKKLRFEEKISNVTKKLDDAEGVEQQGVRRKTTRSEASSTASKNRTTRSQEPEVVWIHEKRHQWASDELQTTNRGTERRSEGSKAMRECSTSRNAEESDSELIVVDVHSDDNEAPPGEQADDKDKKPSEGEQSSQGRRIIVGNYHVLPSDSKFFEIDYEKHYRCNSARRFACNKCSSKSHSGRQRIEDHIWVTHYGGRFNCPFCPSSFSRRDDIRPHMKVRKHK
ncbi:uncharacterized protein LOC107047728 [Diachasma alloeum]|uniref:uncharacterized protein LOC107047728 n=1 Tax=Diachasma alloeum TaxID=454923 RepID=UPI0007381EEE|nr:uncharacterized protein LOC107047728 [Diachasma alloeum]